MKAYIRARWTRKMGGDVALADKAGVSRQTLQAWYADEDMPRLDNLAAVAKALNVRRVDLVAAMDGVTAPETQESAPAWAGALADETAKKVIDALAPGEIRRAAELLIARREAQPPHPDDSSPDPSGAEGQGVEAPPHRGPG